MKLVWYFLGSINISSSKCFSFNWLLISFVINYCFVSVVSNDIDNVDCCCWCTFSSYFCHSLLNVFIFLFFVRWHSLIFNVTNFLVVFFHKIQHFSLCVWWVIIFFQKIKQSQCFIWFIFIGKNFVFCLLLFSQKSKIYWCCSSTHTHTCT
mgnify:CR=1 FL=1